MTPEHANGSTAQPESAAHPEASGSSTRLEPLLSELSRAGTPGHQLPTLDVPEADDLQGQVLRTNLRLPELGELDVVRHFTHLAQRNFSIDSVFYPLGSCTMKYNPRVNEDVARLPGIAHIHPLQPDSTVQGALQRCSELQSARGHHGFKTATPAEPGAQGEGMPMMRAYHLDRGDTPRKVPCPFGARHQPATAAVCAGHHHPQRQAGRRPESPGSQLDDTVVGLMLTNPNTLGLFGKRYEVTGAVHAAGRLMYGDGANLNAILGVVKPAEMSFDCLHINTTDLSTPHGAGSPER